VKFFYLILAAGPDHVSSEAHRKASLKIHPASLACKVGDNKCRSSNLSDDLIVYLLACSFFRMTIGSKPANLTAGSIPLSKAASISDANHIATKACVDAALCERRSSANIKPRGAIQCP
jgi:hypothetical protein